MSHMIDSATLTPSEVTFASGYGVNVEITRLAIRKAGIVYFTNNFYVPAITTTDNPTVAFTLPEGWRPGDISNFTVVAGVGIIGRVRIAPDGTVKVSKILNDIPASSYASASTISFAAVN